jgi:hypothetical protein
MTLEKVKNLINGSWKYEAPNRKTYTYTFMDGTQMMGGNSSKYLLLKNGDDIMFNGQDNARIEHISDKTMVWDKAGEYHLFVRVS